jgi:hypothetical protein
VIIRAVNDKLRSVWLLFLVAAAWGIGCALDPVERRGGKSGPFEFALIGDVPYNDLEATNSFPNLIGEINAARVAFTVHNGDIKAGSTPCTLDLFAERYRQFQTFQGPLLYVLGDNEWSDCPTNGLNPESALTTLRDMFCKGNESLGLRTLRLERQSEWFGFGKFRENLRWTYGDVFFVALNVPGNANNFGKPEAEERSQANLFWLSDSFARAAESRYRALMIVMQANPHFDLPATNQLRRGFNQLLETLERETIALGKPVVLVHGDTHYFRIDKPLVHSRTRRRIENFTRVETFGFPDVHWLRVKADSRDPQVFTFRQQIVEKNRLDHRR